MVLLSMAVGTNGIGGFCEVGVVRAIRDYEAQGSAARGLVESGSRSSGRLPARGGQRIVTESVGSLTELLLNLTVSRRTAR